MDLVKIGNYLQTYYLQSDEKKKESVIYILENIDNFDNDLLKQKVEIFLFIIKYENQNKSISDIVIYDFKGRDLLNELLNSTNESCDIFDLYWTAYFASGDQKFSNYVKSYMNHDNMILAGSASWSYNCIMKQEQL